MKILSLVGARPQFIKEAAVYEKLKEHGIEEILVHSGQHYDFNMSDVFFKVLNIKKPDYNLEVGSSTHGKMTGHIMIKFEEVVLKEKPDVILVYGDTNTTMAGALVGAKLKIPVAHIEAGIRQHPKDMPEEINRVVTDHVSKYLFTPSELASKNLEKEGITNGVYFAGDVMYDVFLKMKPLFNLGAYKKYGLKPENYIVVTIHRDFNTDNQEKLKAILQNLEEIAKEIEVIFPMHPRTRKRIKEYGFEDIVKRVKLIEPIDYLEMMG
ncbi:MAG: UDP-N-acetylglucosamine 2-epimerase (non-hydrolyzing), partial [Thermotogaceae bacterium]|nr:UDP-N-acetylglucosamine 2-epimerase (non-hydrolyzing) [Thermotogaceae bacterium]